MTFIGAVFFYDMCHSGGCVYKMICFSSKTFGFGFYRRLIGSASLTDKVGAL